MKTRRLVAWLRSIAWLNVLALVLLVAALVLAVLVAAGFPGTLFGVALVLVLGSLTLSLLGRDR